MDNQDMTRRGFIDKALRSVAITPVVAACTGSEGFSPLNSDGNVSIFQTEYWRYNEGQAFYAGSEERATELMHHYNSAPESYGLREKRESDRQVLDVRVRRNIHDHKWLKEIIIKYDLGFFEGGEQDRLRGFAEYFVSRGLYGIIPRGSIDEASTFPGDLDVDDRIIATRIRNVESRFNARLTYDGEAREFDFELRGIDNRISQEDRQLAVWLMHHYVPHGLDRVTPTNPFTQE